MKIREYKKQLIAVAIFVLCLAFAWLYPLKAVNVTLQAEFSDAEDGAVVELMIDRGSGQESASKTTAFSQQAQFRFDPMYYDFQSVGMKITNTGKAPVLKSIKAYSGEYDISKDALISASEIDFQLQLQSQGTYYLELDTAVQNELYGAIHQNLSIRWVLTGIFSIVFALTLLFMSKQRQKDWNKFFRYALLIFCGIVLIYVFFNSDFKREASLRVAQVPAPVETTENAGEKPAAEAESQGISLDQSVKQSFVTTYDEIQMVRVYFQTSPIEEGEETTGEFGIRLVDSNSTVVASGVFSAKAIQAKGYAELGVRDSHSQSGEAYTVEIEPLSGGFPASMQILAENGSVEDGQILTVDGQVVPDVTLRCDVGYANDPFIPRLRVLVLICLLALVAFTLAYRKLHMKPELAVFLIYAAVFAYSVGQVLFYMQFVGNTPDEATHISYIAYLVQTGKIIPDFSQMQMLSISGNTASFVDGSLNQLGHPSLYYLVMKLCKPIEIVGENSYLIHLTRLRLFSAAFGLLALAISFYIGYTRISKKQPALHLLYGAIITSVPMFLYNLCGVNNDTFALLGCVVFFLGILRVCEEKKNYGTYFLIAGGFVIAVLSKVTAGMLIGLMAVIYVVWYCVKHKSVKLIFCKEFLFTLPAYLAAAAYFAVVYMKFHTLQPDLNSINPAYYQTSPFFVPFEDRTVMPMFDYFMQYWKNFFDTWTAIASHTSLYKLDHWMSYDRILMLLVLFVPILLFFVKKARQYVVMLIGFYVSLVMVVWMQFQRAFNTYFYVAGYLGAYQTRYYLCVLPILAFIAVYLLQILMERKERPSTLESHSEGMIVLSPSKVAVTISIIASISLFYSGFVYFLFNYFGY